MAVGISRALPIVQWAGQGCTGRADAPGVPAHTISSYDRIAVNPGPAAAVYVFVTGGVDLTRVAANRHITSYLAQSATAALANFRLMLSAV